MSVVENADGLLLSYLRPSFDNFLMSFLISKNSDFSLCGCRSLSIGNRLAISGTHGLSSVCDIGLAYAGEGGMVRGYTEGSVLVVETGDPFFPYAHAIVGKDARPGTVYSASIQGSEWVLAEKTLVGGIYVYLMDRFPEGPITDGLFGIEPIGDTRKVRTKTGRFSPRARPKNSKLVTFNGKEVYAGENWLQVYSSMYQALNGNGSLTGIYSDSSMFIDPMYTTFSLDLDVIESIEPPSKLSVTQYESVFEDVSCSVVFDCQKSVSPSHGTWSGDLAVEFDDLGVVVHVGFGLRKSYSYEF